jgi:hypothetical protein
LGMGWAAEGTGYIIGIIIYIRKQFSVWVKYTSELKTSEFRRMAGVLTEILLWKLIFCDFTPCRLVNSYKCFEDSQYLRFQCPLDQEA